MSCVKDAGQKEKEKNVLLKVFKTVTWLAKAAICQLFFFF